MMAAMAPDLPLAVDLAQDAREVKRLGIPLLVLYSLPDCIYCSEIRQTQLLPMLRNPVQSKRAIVRQINLGGGQGVVGFDGSRTTHAKLARQEGIAFVPVVALLGPDGRNLVDPLKGMLLPDFYAWYLDEAIIGATAALARKS